MNPAKVSIIIPVFNVPEVVVAIRSCLQQTYSHLEIIVVDDGSTVNMRDLLRLFRDPRLNYVRNEEHTNANICRNLGMDKAQGEFIVFLDADDHLVRNHIQTSLGCLKMLQADGIYSSLIWWDGTHTRIYPACLPEANETWPNFLLRRGLSAQTSTLFLSRESALNTRWENSLTRHQDYDFVVRYTTRYRLEIKPEPTVVYNANPFRTKSTVFDEEAFRSCIYFSKTYKTLIEPVVYRKYIQNMLNKAKTFHVTTEIIDYYEKELYDI